jgi:hypothetical protein
VSDLGSAISSAFDQVQSAPEADSTPAEAPESQPVEAAAEPTETTEKAVAAPAETPQEEEPTGDVLLDKLTPEELAAVKQDPRLRKIYAGLMKSYTPKMQALSEQQKLWDALNNPDTKREAVAALARAVGIDVPPSDQPERDKASAVADTISDKWAQVVGPEAAMQLRPLIEETALAAVQGTLKPLQQTAEMWQQDARNRQADAQTTQFRALAKEKGWNVDQAVEAKMVEIGQQFLPAKPITTVQEGVQHLERLYRLATADTSETETEKRILERMNKAAKSAEPGRGVPSTGREKRSNITKEMSLDQALDVAGEELGLTRM